MEKFIGGDKREEKKQCSLDPLRNTYNQMHIMIYVSNIPYLLAKLIRLSNMLYLLAKHP